MLLLQIGVLYPMAAPSCVRDETRDKTRSKTYDKTSVEERRNEEKKQHVLGNDDETNRKRKEDNIWKNRNRSCVGITWAKNTKKANFERKTVYENPQRQLTNKMRSAIAIKSTKTPKNAKFKSKIHPERPKRVKWIMRQLTNMQENWYVKYPRRNKESYGN